VISASYLRGLEVSHSLPQWHNSSYTDLDCWDQFDTSLSFPSAVVDCREDGTGDVYSEAMYRPRADELLLEFPFLVSAK
jgi:hypothetical protein